MCSSRLARLVGLSLLLVAQACGPAQHQPELCPACRTAKYEREVAAWSKARVRALRGETGWLALSGLFWLEPGTHRLGSAEDSDIKLPHAPPRLGELEVRGKRATLRLAPGVEATVEGRAVRQQLMRSDQEAGEQAERVRVGALTLVLIERGGRLALRLYDALAPARKQLTSLPRFAVDPRWRVTARLEPFAEPRVEHVPTVIRTRQRVTIPGTLTFAIDGKTLHLLPYAEPGSDELFINFADATNGHETYGGGRFLHARLEPAGRVVLDFNKAYTPPCAFTDYGTCPVPLPQNRLPIAVRAGERYRPPHGS